MEEFKKPLSLKEQYVKRFADQLCISVEDLTENELKIIDGGFEIFKDRLADIKALEDDNKRLAIELANLKAMTDNSDTYYDGADDSNL